MRHKWNRFKMAEFLEHLGMFLGQGYTIANGILLLQHYQSKEVKRQLDILLQALREGNSIYEGLKDLQIPKDILGYLYFSERNGELSYGLIEGGRMLAKREENKQKLQKLLRYPIFMLWLLVIIAPIMVLYLFPHYQSLFSSLNIELPMLTVMFLLVIEHTPIILMIFISILLVMFCYYMFVFQRYEPHHQFLIMLKIPIVNTFLKLYLTHYFSIQLSRLLKGGLSVYECLTIFEEQEHLPFFQHEGKTMKIRLQRGEKLDAVLRDRPYYQKELAFVISHGQSNGSLSSGMLHYSQILLTLIEEKTKRLIMIIQPLFFFLIGIVVMSMFLSVMLPMFQLINSL